MTVLAQQQQSSPYGSFFFVLMLGLAFYFLGIRPNRRRVLQLRAVQDALAPGRQVVTTAGMYGTVTAVDTDDGTFTLEIAPGVAAKFARGAAMRIVDETEPAAAGAEER